MDIDALRAQTPGCAHRIHLNNAGAALMAQPTLDAMTAQLRREAEIGGGEGGGGGQEGGPAPPSPAAPPGGGGGEGDAPCATPPPPPDAARFPLPPGPRHP